MATTRREFLGGVLVGVTALGTGCVDSSGGGGNSTATNEVFRSATTATTLPRPVATTGETATTTESSRTNAPAGSTRPTDFSGTTDEVPVRKPPACDEDVHRLSYPIDEVRYGSLGGFALTASKKTVARGEPISFRLANTTDSEKVTGNKRKYDIQRRTDDGWESIHWVPDKYGYNDVGISHPPGTGFTWTFPFSRNGLEQSTQFNTPYSVCEDFVSGDYRFIYWGVGSEAERKSDYEKEYAVGVRFSVVRS